MDIAQHISTSSGFHSLNAKKENRVWCWKGSQELTIPSRWATQTLRYSRV
jgi:hypothetical protein